MPRKFSQYESICGRSSTGVIVDGAEGRCVKWDCGCWQLDGLDGDHEPTVLEEHDCRDNKRE